MLPNREDSTGNKFVLSPTDEVPLEMQVKLEKIARIKFKNIKMDTDYIYSCYGDTTFDRYFNTTYKLNKSTIYGHFRWETGYIQDVFRTPLVLEDTGFLSIVTNDDLYNGFIVDFSARSSQFSKMVCEYNQYFINSGEDYNIEELVYVFDSAEAAPQTKVFDVGHFDDNGNNAGTENITHFATNIKDFPSENKSFFFVENELYDTSFGYTLIKTLTNEIFLDYNISNDEYTCLTNTNYLEHRKLSNDELIFESITTVNTRYFLNMIRKNLNYVDTSNDGTFINLQNDFLAPIRLFSFFGTRYDCSIAIANSFLKKHVH